MTKVKTPLAADLQYSLDCMTEFGELDSGSATIVQLYGDRNLVERTLDIREGRTRTEDIALALMRHAWDIAHADLSPHERGAMLGMGLMHRAHDIIGCARCMAEWAIGDFVEGGYAKGYGVAYSKDRLTPSKRNLRRLHAPAWIRRHVKRDSETARLRRLANAHILAVGLEPWQHLTFDPAAWKVAFDAARERQRAMERQRWREVWGRMENGATAEEAIRRVDPKPPPGFFKQRRQRRKVMRRSVAMAEAVLGIESARAFMRGNLVIPGHEIDFRVSPRGTLSLIGHGAMEVAVLSKEDGLALANLCLYYKNTPAIEQAVALALEVQAGDEREVLRTANLTSVTPAGVNHPVIIERRAVDLAHIIGSDAIVEAVEGDAWEDTPIPLTLTDKGRRELRNMEYWQETKDIWTEALRTQVFGRVIAKIVSSRLVESDRIAA